MPTKRNNEVKDFAIGTKIEYNGKLYEVVEELFCDNCSIANICTNAEFTNVKKSDNLLSRKQRYSIFGECSNLNRADGTSIVFKEIPKDDSKDEYYKVLPLWIDDNSIQLRPVEFDLPKGYEIDKEHSDLDKGIIKFKNKWLSLEQLYKTAKDTNYHTCLSEIKDFTDDKSCTVRDKLIALANLIDIARYFNGNWKFDSEKDTHGYAIAFYYNTTEYPQYNVVAISSTCDIYYGNPVFKNEADAKYVVDNPNFRTVLDKIFKE